MGQEIALATFALVGSFILLALIGFVAVWRRQYRLLRTRWGRWDSLVTGFRVTLVILGRV